MDVPRFCQMPPKPSALPIKARSKPSTSVMDAPFSAMKLSKQQPARAIANSTPQKLSPTRNISAVPMLIMVVPKTMTSLRLPSLSDKCESGTTPTRLQKKKTVMAVSASTAPQPISRR